jgi:hypothetical protein
MLRSVARRALRRDRIEQQAEGSMKVVAAICNNDDQADEVRTKEWLIERWKEVDDAFRIWGRQIRAIHALAFTRRQTARLAFSSNFSPIRQRLLYGQVVVFAIAIEFTRPVDWSTMNNSGPTQFSHAGVCPCDVISTICLQTPHTLIALPLSRSCDYRKLLDQGISRDPDYRDALRCEEPPRRLRYSGDVLLLASGYTRLIVKCEPPRNFDPETSFNRSIWP